MSAARAEAAYGRLEAWSARDGIPCRCPPGYGPGTSGGSAGVRERWLCQLRADAAACSMPPIPAMKKEGTLGRDETSTVKRSRRLMREQGRVSCSLTWPGSRYEESAPCLSLFCRAAYGVWFLVGSRLAFCTWLVEKKCWPPYLRNRRRRECRVASSGI